MSAVLITNISIRNPKDYFTEPIRMRLDLEVLHVLSREVEFRVVYIGSPDSSEKDQVLELVRLQPLPVGRLRRLTQASTPSTWTSTPPTSARSPRTTSSAPPSS